MTENRTRQAPAERFDSPMLSFDLAAELRALRAESTPARSGHRQKALCKHGGFTVALFDLEPGGALSDHSTKGAVSIQGVEGELVVSAAGQERRVAPGTLVVFAPGVTHAVHAESSAAFLLHVGLCG